MIFVKTEGVSIAMRQKFVYVANWKMNSTLNSSLTWVAQNLDELIAISNDAQLIICPSDVALYPLDQFLTSTNIKLGAQNCSSHLAGSFTGETSAVSLKEAGCSFCIIGHAEQRKYHQETDSGIAKKFLHLVENNISPIVCIGETQDEYQEKNTLLILEQQLKKIVAACSEIFQTLSNPIYIAYEPVWAIGTGNIPTKDHLEVVLSWVSQFMRANAPAIQWKLLYGGSTNATNIDYFKNIDLIDGFLIGAASVNFQELKKMIYSGSQF